MRIVRRVPGGKGFWLLAAAVILTCASCDSDDAAVIVGPYDIVIVGGRVMDPMSGFDQIAAVGINQGKIASVATNSDLVAAMVKAAAKTLDASARVVSPGFINTHTHEGTIQDSMKVYVKDGITTWVGGNCGSSHYRLADYYAETEAAGMYNNYASLTGLNRLRTEVGLDFRTPASPEQIDQMVGMLRLDLEDGSMGVSFGSYYGPGCTYEEMLATAQEAAANGGMASSHIRDNLFNAASLGLINFIINARFLEEAIETARQSQVPYLVSHITDITYGNGTTGYALGAISRAINQEGLHMAVDVIGADSFPNDFFTIVRYGEYPLDILMALADAQPSDFQVTEDVYIDGTLYMEAFSACESVEQAQTLLTAIQEGRAQSPGVLCHIVDPANTMLALAEPFVFVGNDGYVDRIEATGELDGHPRAAGTFSRFLGHWARDNGVMNLMQALYKATAAPAIWFGLETKGRIQAGADADLVVFDPEGIIDMANTDDKSHFLEPPSGIDYVVVAGSVVVDHGRLTGSTPGKVIRRTWAVPGLHGWQLGD